MKVQTIDIKGKDYAKVPQRLLEFRKKYPRSDVITKPEFQADGMIVFTAKIVKDKADETSASATGHSYGKQGQEKAFEKLETVAVGRALALLGYLNNGEIATTEEMQEFEEYQFDRIRDEISLATTRDEFAMILKRLTPAQKLEATPLINARIKELKDEQSDTSGTA